MALLARLRGFYASTFGAEALRDIRALWHLGEVSVALPQYLVLRSEGAVSDGDLDVAFSVLAKAMAGINLTLQHAALSSLIPGSSERVTADSLFALAERSGHFVGRATDDEHEACAAPAAMIKYVLEALLEGKPEPTRLDVPPCPDFARLFSFGAVMINFFVAYVGLAIAQQCANGGAPPRSPASPFASRAIVQRIGAAIAAGTVDEWSENLLLVDALGLDLPGAPSLGAELTRALAARARPMSKTAWYSMVEAAFLEFLAASQAAALGALGFAPSRPRIDPAILRDPAP
jgi:hypothetical protein